MKTAVVLIIFKRPDTTEKVFEVIRKVKPEKLFIIADAPRPERVGEVEKSQATRAIIEKIVKKNIKSRVIATSKS